VPEKVLTNADLTRMVDTSDEWITTRTGIKERRIAAKDEHTSDMAAKAALKAIEQAKISPKEINLIIVATATPDMLFPATACFVQKKIGATNQVGKGAQSRNGLIFAPRISRTQHLCYAFCNGGRNIRCAPLQKMPQNSGDGQQLVRERVLRIDIGPVETGMYRRLNHRGQ